MFAGLLSGQYTVRVTFPGFTPFERVVAISAGSTIQLPIQMKVSAAEKQEVTVQGEAGPSLSVEPDNNATALVLKGEDLEALPDDPDDLADALQALAGPGAGPNGGQIYIDGFSGGQLPPKESIREIRINQNPFSAEYDRLGFGRIEILTKPGTDKFRGSVFFNDSDGVFNSRNPFATNKPDYSNRMYRRQLRRPDQQALLVLPGFQPARHPGQRHHQRHLRRSHHAAANAISDTAVVTPNVRTTIGPRVDYQLTTNNTLVARFEDGTGYRATTPALGGYHAAAALCRPATTRPATTQNLMLTETAIAQPQDGERNALPVHAQLQQSAGQPAFRRSAWSGAFTGGGNGMGNNYDTAQHFELQNYTSIPHGAHTIRFGVRAAPRKRPAAIPIGFGGTFSFLGGLGAGAGRQQPDRDRRQTATR